MAFFLDWISAFTLVTDFSGTLELGRPGGHVPPPPPTLLLFGVMVAIKGKYKDSWIWTKLNLIPYKFLKSDVHTSTISLLIFRHLWKITNCYSCFSVLLKIANFFYLSHWLCIKFSLPKARSVWVAVKVWIPFNAVQKIYSKLPQLLSLAWMQNRRPRKTRL